MTEFLIGEPCFTSNAPKYAEIIEWEKDGRDYFAAINEQEESPIAPLSNIYIDVKKPDRKAYLLPDGKELKTEVMGDTLRVYLPKLEVFCMIELR